MNFNFKNYNEFLGAIENVTSEVSVLKIRTYENLKYLLSQVTYYCFRLLSFHLNHIRTKPQIELN